MSRKLKHTQPPASKCNMFSQKQPRPNKSASFQTAASLLGTKPSSPPTSSRSINKGKDISFIKSQTGLANNKADPSKATADKIDAADKDNPNKFITLTAGVEFSQRFMESHPNRNVSWAIYGRLVNVLKDEVVEQSVLLLQNLPRGSLLQAYYSPHMNRTKFKISNVLRVIGGYEKMGQGCGWRFNASRIDNMSDDIKLNGPDDIEDIVEFVSNKERSLAEVYPLN